MNKFIPLLIDLAFFFAFYSEIMLAMWLVCHWLDTYGILGIPPVILIFSWLIFCGIGFIKALHR